MSTISNSNNKQIANIHFSAQFISINPITHQGQFIITNTHHNYSIAWKIKTNKLNVFEVKPVKGLIKPGEKAEIHFKVINQIEEKQMESIQKNDKFLLQAINIEDSQVKKEAIEMLWKSVKEKTANLELGYCCCKISIDLRGKKEERLSKGGSPTFRKLDQISNSPAKERSSVIQSKVSRFSSIESASEMTESTGELSNKFQSLKKKEQELVERRDSLFKSSSDEKQNKGNKTVIILLILFAISFLAGNYARARLSRQHQEEQ